MKSWNIAGSNVIGVGHEDKGHVVEDKIYSLRENGIAIIALCDGVGSAKHAAQGATFFSKTISELLVEHFDDIYQNTEASVTPVIDYLISELYKTFKIENVNDYASTLLAVAVKEDRYLILHIGDGVIGALNNGFFTLLSDATNFGYANITISVTNKQAADYLTIKKGNIDDLTAFFLMSDGSQESLYNSQRNEFANILYPIIELVQEDEEEATEQLEEVIRLKFRQRTRDDCSLIVLAQKSSSTAIYWEDYLDLSYISKNFLLNELPQNKRKGVSIEKIDTLLLPIIRSAKTRQELWCLWEGSRKSVFNNTLKVLINQGLVEFNPSKNKYFYCYYRDLK